MKIAALGLVFCGSVVSGNFSLQFLPVSFNQAIGATTPFFTAVFAYVMTVKREDWLTYAALVPVDTGVVIASGGEPSFHLFGFIICIAATVARALKSVLQGILLSSEGEKLNSMNLLLYMAPIAVVFLLPATLLMEENVVGITLALARKDTKIIWYLLFNSALAYFVNLTNFLVTKHTSALTLQDSKPYEYGSTSSLSEPKYGFWGVLAKKAKSILEDDNIAEILETSGRTKPQVDTSTGDKRFDAQLPQRYNPTRMGLFQATDQNLFDWKPLIWENPKGDWGHYYSTRTCVKEL